MAVYNFAQNNENRDQLSALRIKYIKLYQDRNNECAEYKNKYVGTAQYNLSTHIEMLTLSEETGQVALQLLSLVGRQTFIISKIEELKEKFNKMNDPELTNFMNEKFTILEHEHVIDTRPKKQIYRGLAVGKPTDYRKQAMVNWARQFPGFYLASQNETDPVAPESSISAEDKENCLPLERRRLQA